MNYILGKGDKALEIINSIKNENGKGLVDHLIENCERKNKNGYTDYIFDLRPGTDRGNGVSYENNTNKTNAILSDMESFKYKEPEKSVGQVPKKDIRKETEEIILEQEAKSKEFLEREKAEKLKRKENKENEQENNKQSELN